MLAVENYMLHRLAGHFTNIRRILSVMQSHFLRTCELVSYYSRINVVCACIIGNCVKTGTTIAVPAVPGPMALKKYGNTSYIGMGQVQDGHLPVSKV